MHAHRVFTFALVGICISVPLCLAGFASEEAPKVGSNLMLPTILHGVTLGTLLDKCLLALFNVSSHF